MSDHKIPANNTISSSLEELRSYPAALSFSSTANIRTRADYDALYTESILRPEEFWRRMALDFMEWRSPFDSILTGEAPNFRWFEGATLNASFLCVDRHARDTPDKPALIWQGEPENDVEIITYRSLLERVCQCALALKELGLKKGDVVTIYMPMIPELAVTVLACARLGVTHNVVFGGFSAHALSERCNDSRSKVLVTADGGWRRGEKLDLRSISHESLKTAYTLEKVLLVKRFKDSEIKLHQKEVLWSELVSRQETFCEPTWVESEHPLFLLYTSGSTGKPKGVVHSTAGYLLQTQVSFHYVFDLKPKDIYWCTADVGWITGHSYIVYGPLARGATVMMYEGAPMHPTPARVWELIDKFKVSIFYTAPTAIRAFMRAGDEFLNKSSLTSLRLLGTVGEPINPSVWVWYYEKVGKSRCPVVDTWWQTETGSIMIAPTPGAVAQKPGTATLPVFGVKPEILGENGEPVKQGEGGYLVISKPWPSMLRGVYGDNERFIKTYWERFPGKYFTGDGARQDKEGYFWLLGRMDDVINVSGHRLSTMEIESALVSHPSVSEAATVGVPDDLRGEAIACFVTLKTGVSRNDNLNQILNQHVVKEIGALARPKLIVIVDALPKTRSGKIMRRLLKKVASGETDFGDTTTLEDNTLAALRLRYAESLNRP